MYQVRLVVVVIHPIRLSACTVTGHPALCVRSRFFSPPFLGKACPTAPALVVLRTPWSFDLRRVGMASANHELRRSNLRNLVLQHLCRVCLFFVVPGCARASSSNSALVHSSSSFTERSLDSGGMVPRIWNNIWRFFRLSFRRPEVQSKRYASNVPSLERRMFRMLLHGVLLGRMPVSAFRVRHVGRKPYLQQVTAHAVCLAKVRGRCPLKPPLAEDKVHDINVVVVNSGLELPG